MESLKLKADQIPANAKRLFVQLYCERKGEKNKKTIQEAKNSWASLSFSKKKLFYKTIADTNILNYAHGLSKSKLYLKEKMLDVFEEGSCMQDQELETQETVSTIDKSNSPGSGSQLGENEFVHDNIENDNKNRPEEESLETQPIVGRSLCELNPSSNSKDTNLKDTSERQVNIESSVYDPSPPNEMNERQDALESQSSNLQINKVQLTEPTPPIVGLGKDLYEMIKEPGSVEWRALDRKDKNHYHTAVRAIKREYIKNYTKYLESLSQQQLFDHYMKTLH